MTYTRLMSTSLFPALPLKTSVQALASGVSHRDAHLDAPDSPSSPHSRSWTNPMMASLQDVRALKLLRRLPSRLQMNLDLAREGIDFSIWMVTAIEGLSKVRYKAMQQALKDGLSKGCNTKLPPAQSDQGAQAKLSGDFAPKARSIKLDCAISEVVALHDGGLGGNDPLQCSFVFLYQVDQDPTSILPLIRRGNCSFKSISKLIPVTEAMRGAAKSIPDEPLAVDPGLTRPAALTSIDLESIISKTSCTAS